MYLKQLADLYPNIVKKETIAESNVSSVGIIIYAKMYIKQHRKVEMVTITGPAHVKDSTRDVKKRTVLVMGRQTPGESPSSYVVQGNPELKIT